MEGSRERRAVGNGERGVTLLVVILLGAIILACGAFGARSAWTELRVAQNELMLKQAQATAEAGANRAVRVIRDNPGNAVAGTAGALTNLGGSVGHTPYDAATNYRFVSF